MRPTGFTVERRAPAALGARLSQAIFFIDPKLGAELIKAQWRLFAGQTQCARELADDPDLDAAQFRDATLHDSEQELLRISFTAFHLVQRQLNNSKLIGNGILAAGRYDMSPSVWESPPRSVDELQNWLLCKLPLAGSRVLEHIRVRPRYEVSHQVAAHATGDRRHVALLLLRGSSDKMMAAQVSKPLDDAIAAGLVARASSSTVLFHDDFEDVSVPHVIVDNFPEEKTQDKGGRPRVWDWDEAIASAGASFANEPDLKRRGLQARITRFLADKMNDGGDGPAQSELDKKAAKVLQVIGGLRSPGNR